MNISIVGTVGLPGNYGGFESLVENLVLNRSEAVDYHVFCSKVAYTMFVDDFNGAKLTYIPLKANGVQSIPYDICSLISCIRRKPDIVLILGVSGCLFLPIYKLFSRSKIITNIDGLEWKRDKWGFFTKKFLKISEHFAVHYSDEVITDNQAITDYVLSEYNVISHTIAYGGDHAIRDGKVNVTQENYALALCRIEPENNVDMILDSFSKSKVPLKFIGNWHHSEFSKALLAKYNEFENIEMMAPIYDLDTLYTIRSNCKVYIHGHSAGGTNPSLVEMMHFGIPILAFDCVFNRYSTEGKADYFKDSVALTKLIDDFSMEINTGEGVIMKKIAEKKYTWEIIASKYEALFI